MMAPVAPANFHCVAVVFSDDYFATVQHSNLFGWRCAILLARTFVGHSLMKDGSVNSGADVHLT